MLIRGCILTFCSSISDHVHVGHTQVDADGDCCFPLRIPKMVSVVFVAAGDCTAGAITAGMIMFHKRALMFTNSQQLRYPFATSQMACCIHGAPRLSRDATAPTAAATSTASSRASSSTRSRTSSSGTQRRHPGSSSGSPNANSASLTSRSAPRSKQVRCGAGCCAAQSMTLGKNPLILPCELWEMQ